MKKRTEELIMISNGNHELSEDFKLKVSPNKFEYCLNCPVGATVLPGGG